MSLGFNQETAPPIKSRIISIFVGSILDKSFVLKGRGSVCITPSTTQIGSAFPNKVEVPRTRIRCRVPVSPLVFVTIIPGILPCKACSNVCEPFNNNSSALTLLTEPAIERSFTRWYPVTTTSSISATSSCITTSIVFFPAHLTSCVSIPTKENTSTALAESGTISS